jgi:hypothetical protein
MLACFLTNENGLEKKENEVDTRARFTFTVDI